MIKDISIRYKIQSQDIELCEAFFQPVLMPNKSYGKCRSYYRMSTTSYIKIIIF